jgi:hypothetical protein
MALASNKIDWKPAIILSSIFLEKFGKFKLKNIFKNRKLKLDKKIESLSLSEVTTFLYGFHQINNKEYTIINQIRREKKRIINPKDFSNLTFSGEKANKKYNHLIKNSLKIISSLKINS